MKPLGVDYFSPQKLITDATHPEVLFIECLGSIVILDINNSEQMVLLDEIVSPDTLNKFYRIAVNYKRMIFVSDPDIIYEYSLEDLYSKNKVVFIKKLPLYHYSIQSISDIDFSSIEDTVYINAVDPIKNVSVILVYRTRMPAATSLYDTIHLDRLYTRPDL